MNDDNEAKVICLLIPAADLKMKNLRNKNIHHLVKSNTFFSNNFRFWMHVYDQPGSQLDEAVTAVAKAFKWRKSYGVENLDDSALNR